MKLLGKKETIYDTTSFARQGCIHCGITFYWPAELDDRARNNARGFWCPGCGGSMVYRETETDRLRRTIEDERAATEFNRKEAQRARERELAAKRRVTAMKGVVTRTKKRIAAGKCVRCSTEFPDLADHMAACHPDFDSEAE